MGLFFSLSASSWSHSGHDGTGGWIRQLIVMTKSSVFATQGTLSAMDRGRARGHANWAQEDQVARDQCQPLAGWQGRGVVESARRRLLWQGLQDESSPVNEIAAVVPGLLILDIVSLPRDLHGLWHCDYLDLMLPFSMTAATAASHVCLLETPSGGIPVLDEYVGHGLHAQ